MKQKSVTNRVEADSEGIGEVSDEMIEQRANKLAAADGRSEANTADRFRAREDLTGTPEEPAEDFIAESDRPGDGTVPGSGGHQAPKLELDD